MTLREFRRSIPFFVVLLMLLWTCQRDPGYSLTPYIEFRKITYVAKDAVNDNKSALKIELYFEDGDGNLGLSDGDTSGIFAKDTNSQGQITNLNYYNYIGTFLIKNADGSFKTCDESPNCPTADSILNIYYGRFQRLNGDKTQPISGTLTYYMWTSKPWGETFASQTLKLQIYIKDRDLNQSNVITTDTLHFN